METVARDVTRKPDRTLPKGGGQHLREAVARARACQGRLIGGTYGEETQGRRITQVAWNHPCEVLHERGMDARWWHPVQALKEVVLIGWDPREVFVRRRRA